MNETTQPQAPARPGVATTWGVLNCVWGGLGLFSIFNLSQISADPMGLYEFLGNDFKMWAMTATLLGFIASVWLLCCGIGLLNLKRWGRSGSVIYAIYGIIMSVVGPVMVILTSSEIDLAPAILKGGFHIGLISGIIFGLLYSILLLVFMKGKTMRESYG